jgi:FMN hydrolase / 5-amino-6-(5-phospho-D-ribitylamino)uracil phosphatase
VAQRWICFDVGETLIDETRVWSIWADMLGVTRLTFMAALGAVIEREQDHREVFNVVGRPHWVDLRDEFEQRYGGFQAVDLYSDAVASLGALRDAGYGTAIFANQPEKRTRELRALGIQPDLIAMSDELGFEKPSPEFYARCLELMRADASDVAYVGDRLDNDVRPSAAAGMRPVFIRRGPWGVIADASSVPAGTLVVDSLNELVERVDELWA